jgi:phage tail sheath protein FI
MATFPNGPGVYVNESLRSSLAPTASVGTAAVFFGEAERGPSAITLIQDWSSYKAIYGDLDDAYDLGYAVYHFFANGGRNCYVVRVTAAAAVAAEYDDVPFYPAGGAVSGGSVGLASLLDVAAISAGEWGNSLTVQLTPGNLQPTATTHGSFNLIVNYKGVEVERWLELSVDPNSNRYVFTVVNTYSNYIRVSGVNPTNASATAVANADVYPTTTWTLAGGSSGTVQGTDYTSSFNKVDTVRGNLILNAVGRDDVISDLVTKAETRGDSFVIIDPQPIAADNPNPVLALQQNNWSSASGYAAYYAPMLKMVDPAKSGVGAVRDTYPGGAVAGMIVRTDVQRTVAKAPAGFSADIRGALGIAVPLSDAQVGQLYDGTPHTNVFKAVPGAGIVVYGARTLSRVQPDKFIPVRRTLNYLKVALKDITQYAVFEPNDQNLWDSLTATVSGFLAEFYRSGGLRGDNASQAFYVVCGSTNNTAASIDQGIVNVEVGVALQYPAEYIVINLSQWTGGSNAVESL